MTVISSKAVIKRIDFGYFVRPGSETPTGQPRVEAVLGYAIVHPQGVLLFDTGMGEGDPEVEAHYRPVRQPLFEALRRQGIGVDDIRWLANCHLHFDHCGGNPELSGRPVFVQASELQQARTVIDYTLPRLIEGGHYQQIVGEVEILPGVLAIPTPGHTNGHQALAIRAEDGTVILAGQSYNTAFDYTSEQLAWRAAREGMADGPVIAYQPWIDRLQALDPARVVFAHDYAVWEPA